MAERTATPDSHRRKRRGKGTENASDKELNKTTRTASRWTHLLLGWPVGVLVCAPMRGDDTFVLLMQVVFIPLIVITGVWMRRQARIRRCTAWARDPARGRDAWPAVGANVRGGTALGFPEAKRREV